MKKTLLTAAVCLIAGCSQLSQYMPSSSSSSASNDSWRAKMQTCLVNEAQSRFQAGTLFNFSVSETADELVSVCTKKLALQSLGISDEAKSSAETIITSLKNMSAQ